MHNTGIVVIVVIGFGISGAPEIAVHVVDGQ